MTQTLEKVVGGSRAAVLRSLEGGIRSVSEIVEETGLSQPNVSNHLARLREQGLVIPRREGKRIYYGLSDPDLVRALLSLPQERTLTPAEQRKALSRMVPAFDDAVLALNHEGARVLVDRALAQGIPWQALYRQAFEPLLVKIGQLWECGQLSVSEEHAASQLVDRMMSHVASLRIPASRGRECDVVVACVEGEHHQIGPRMLADFLSAEGWRVVFLGANVPNEALEAYARRYRPGVVALSAATEDRIEAVRDMAQRIHAMANGVKPPRLLLGGGLFQNRPDLVGEVGAEPAPSSLDSALELLGSRRKAK